MDDRYTSPMAPDAQERPRDRVFTGLLDKHCTHIHYGDRIRIGMRRGYLGGITFGRVDRGHDGLPCLVDMKTGEKGQMQWDQELREIIGGP